MARTRVPGGADGTAEARERRADEPSRTPTGRTVVRRRSLPGTRAVAGGFLIALAGVLAFYGYSTATRTPRELYVIASTDLTIGGRITPADVGTVGLDVPAASVRSQLFGDVNSVIGASVIAPIAKGSLIEASEVVGRGGAVGTEELSLEIARSRAVGGTLKPGEYVDVLATYGQGSTSYTAVVVPRVRVLTVAAADGGSLGGSSDDLIVFAVPNDQAAEAIADANVAAQVTLVRAEEEPDGAPATSIPSYQAPSGP